MKLISYEQFAALRLRDFVPQDVIIADTPDWEWMHSLWHNEGIGFTSFSRHVSRPNETGGLEIAFSELPDECIERLLVAIGLPLRPGMSAAEVLKLLGAPTSTHQFAPDRQTYGFTIGTASQPYHLDCTIDHAQGLVFVVVIRSDLLFRDEE
jgi:hypothetical protein